MSHWVKRAAEIIHNVGVWHTVIVLVALLAHTYLPDLITTSKKLQEFIVGGVALGGPVGFFRTGFAWAGRGRPKCLRRGMIYFVLWGLFLITLLILPIEVLSAAVAEKFPTLRGIREFLLTWMLLTNTVVFFGGFLSSFFLAGGITLCSAKLANPRGSAQ